MERPEPDWTVWRVVYAVALGLVVVLFFLSLRGILNPFLLFLLLLLLLSPFAGSRAHLLLTSAAGLLTGLWLLDTLGSLLAPFFLAVVFAYLLYPLVRRIERRGVSRGLAIALLSLPLLVGLVLGVLVGLPALGRQVAELTTSIPVLLKSLVAWADRMQVQLVRRDLPFVDEQVLLARLRTVRPELVLQYLQGRQEEIAQRAWAAVVGAGRGVNLVLTIVGYLFLTPILTFYLLRDWERITASLADLVPRAARMRVMEFFREYDRLLAGYMRGTVLGSSIVGALTMVGLWVLGIPYAFLLGVLAAVFNLIPYVGLLLTLIPATLVALFTDHILLSLGKVVLVFVVVQGLEGAVISPRIVGESVGLHPVWVILALSVAGFFWGFVGLLLAIPLAVLLKLLLAAGLERYRRSAVFRGAHA